MEGVPRLTVRMTMTAKRTLIPALVLAGGLACTASAQAQPYGNAWGYSRGDTRAAFDNGYRSGFDRGRDDARRQRYDYGRHDEYRSANSGYERSYGDRDQYRDTFRRGFVSGYDDGYYGRNTRDYSYSNDRYRNDDRYRPLPAAPPVYGPAAPPVYGSAYPSAPGYGGSYGGSYGFNPGYDRGYREGLDKGRNDGKHHDSYDPRRQKWYRDGDRGYKDEYGSRRTYENSYRDGFLRGYDQGYRERNRY
jgi:hypothetical protein